MHGLLGEGQILIVLVANVDMGAWIAPSKGNVMAVAQRACHWINSQSVI